MYSKVDALPVRLWLEATDKTPPASRDTFALELKGCLETKCGGTITFLLTKVKQMHRDRGGVLGPSVFFSLHRYYSDFFFSLRLAP